MKKLLLFCLMKNSNDTEHCTDIKCNIKTSKISYLKVKEGNARSAYIYSHIYGDSLIYFRYKRQKSGWVEIIIKNNSSGFTNNLPIGSSLVLSPRLPAFFILTEFNGDIVSWH